MVTLFVNQVRFLGIKPCLDFVEQTNGVVERFNRALRKQAIYGKVLRNIEEVRRAVGKFTEDYTARWRIEECGFVSPRRTRQAWCAALSQPAA